MKKSDVESLKKHVDSIKETVYIFCAEGENSRHKEFFDSTFSLLKEDIDYRSQNPIKRFFVDLRYKYLKWKHRNDSIACTCTIKLSELKKHRPKFGKEILAKVSESIAKIEDEKTLNDIIEMERQK